jgi:hypothetical protein
MPKRNWTAPKLRLLQLLYSARVPAKTISRLMGCTDSSVRAIRHRTLNGGPQVHIFATTPLDDLQWLANQVEGGEGLPAIMARIIRDARVAQRSGLSATPKPRQLT